MTEALVKNQPHSLKDRPDRLPRSFNSRLRTALELWIDSSRAARHDDSIFIWIPKNAGTSVYTMLHANGLVKLNTLRAVQLFCRNKGRITFGHMAIGSLIDLGLVSREFVDRSFKFALTRDPYARAASLYRIYSKMMANWHKKQTFREFLQVLADGHYDCIGPYDRRVLSPCNPQVEWLRSTPPDKVYKVEEIGEFVKDISEQWKIRRPDLVHMNWTSREGQLELARDEKALIERVYEEDFETFGYPKR